MTEKTKTPRARTTTAGRTKASERGTASLRPETTSRLGSNPRAVARRNGKAALKSADLAPNLEVAGPVVVAETPAAAQELRAPEPIAAMEPPPFETATDPVAISAPPRRASVMTDTPPEIGHVEDAALAPAEGETASRPSGEMHPVGSGRKPSKVRGAAQAPRNPKASADGGARELVAKPGAKMAVPSKSTNLGQPALRLVSRSGHDRGLALAPFGAFEPTGGVTAAVEAAHVGLRTSDAVQAQFAAFAQDALAASAEALRDLAACRSLREIFAQQARQTRLVADVWMRQAGRMRDLYAAALPDGRSVLPAPVLPPTPPVNPH